MIVFELFTPFDTFLLRY